VEPMYDHELDNVTIKNKHMASTSSVLVSFKLSSNKGLSSFSFYY